ncbi:MAG: cyclic nucleotide-binding domain-containing protein [Acidobacteriota bacterium]|nr:cyclic nucleotide-binding domain-containing protein [Acidobacteriota bacterium]MDH3522640.1 cyclic nucleotide-binding domain-containing protein [Acidobacteriota bacterium]
MSRAPHEDLLDSLRSSTWFSEVDPEQLTGVAERVETVALEAGEHLFRQGDPGDALYLVVAGRLRAFGVRDDGGEIPLAEIGPGGSVGEIQLLTGGERTACVAALEASRLIKVPTEVFDELAAASPAMLERMIAVNRRRLDRSLLAEGLPSLLGALDEEALLFLETEVEWIDLERGELLFDRGDAGEAMYVLLRGRLAAVSAGADGAEHELAQIGRGECVGEMGLLTGSRRSVAVRALRDSRLVRFSRESFDRVVARFPQALAGVTKVLVQRLLRTTPGAESAPATATVRTIAVLPARGDLAIEGFLERLVGALRGRGPTLRLSRERIRRHFGARGDLGPAGDGPASMRLKAWLDDQELAHRFVVYEPDATATPWTATCLRQADQVLVVTEAGRPPEAGRVDALLACETRSDVKARSTLIVLHEDADRKPSGTGGILDLLGLERHQHVRAGRTEDVARLARLFDGRALGLALGGGGARAFAHIGVLRALEEAGIEVDMIGGTSVGSFMAAMYAMGWTPEAMVEASRKGFLERRPFRDPTLPVFGLVAGRRGRKVSRELLGEPEIEDLWINFFAVSANLTTASQVIHSRGGLVDAVAASMSVPGAIVPVVSGHDLLVDGGVLNNLPSDVMRGRCGGRVIAVDVSPENELSVATKGERLPSPWKVLWSHVNPFMQPMQVPHLMSILMRASTLASVQNERLARWQADLYLKPPVDRFGLFEMSAIDEIVELGYRYACEKLAAWSLEGEPPTLPP